jgi:hypothetical protein
MHGHKNLKFLINIQEIFQTNSSIHNINARNNHHLHRTTANLSCLQNGMFKVGIKIFNILPPSVRILKKNKAKFRAAFRKYFHTQSFYSVDEFFMCGGDL